jgi:hypothetical protein
MLRDGLRSCQTSWTPLKQGRHKFRIYLELKEIKSEQTLLEFWEKCNTFLLKAKKPTTAHKDGAKDIWS